jgi:TolB-like protein/DNA-binding winged helix-turn-helix (wHTH) protein
MSDTGPAGKIVAFGSFQCDLCARELHKNGIKVHLADQPFQLLAVLLERPGELVTRQELQERLWPDQSYGDFSDGLNTAVNKLRAALDDKAANPRFIETIPRRGYRLIADVKSPDSRPPVPPAQREPSEGVSSGAEQGTFPAGMRPQAGLQHPKFRALAGAGATAALALVVLGLFLHFSKGTAKAGLLRTSLAVLPFQNLTGDPADDYLSSGITQEMITRFAHDYGRDLRVIARDSAVSFRGGKKTLPQIAAELKVQYVLQGSLQAEKNHLRVSAQLIRASDGASLWADSYDGDASQILDFEDNMAQSVAGELSLKLLAGRARPYVPSSYAAHDDYLRGLYFLSQRSRQGLEQALQSFAAATASDPHYARAYAELAVTYNLMGEYGWIYPGYVNSLGKAAAEQAIADDPSLSEAHAALGFSDWFYEWNSAAAVEELQRAIQLDPDNADARHWYSQVLMTGGRFPEAERQMQAALSLDPKSLILRTNQAWLHYFERRYPQATEELKGVVRDDPDFLTAHYKLWEVYSVRGDEPDAWRECRVLVHSVCNPEREKKILSAYRRAGYAAALESFAVTEGANYYGSEVDSARCMMFAGDRSHALEYLQLAYRQKDGWMVFVPVDPAFDSLRADSRFAHLTLEVRPPRAPSS